MPAAFPHVYNATVRRTWASRARIDAPPRPSLDGGPSVQLDGDSAAWSPEHLVLSSLGVCMLSTFEAFAARDRIELLSWDAHARGEVDRTPEGLMFTSIVLTIVMEVAGNLENLPRTLEDTKRYCLVLNSLRVPVVIETEIRSASHEPLDIAV